MHFLFPLCVIFVALLNLEGIAIAIENFTYKNKAIVLAICFS